MALTELELVISVPASGDLSASIYHWVALDSNGNAVVVSGAGANAIGVLLNKPTALGQAAEVKVLGRVKIVSGATINPMQKVASTASGTAQVAVSTNTQLGICLVGGVSGDVIEVLLQTNPILA